MLREEEEQCLGASGSISKGTVVEGMVTPWEVLEKAGLLASWETGEVLEL